MSSLKWSISVLALVAASCSLLELSEVADWEPAPGQTLTPETRTIEILVHERGCSGGDSARGRIDNPEVEYLEDSVVVTIWVRPKAGDQNCPSSQ